MYNPVHLGVIVIAFAVIVSSRRHSHPRAEKTLFDFTSSDTVDAWTEQSDTVRTVGLSKATAAIFKNSVSKRAVFFALLNLQPNGAGFAGMHTDGPGDLSAYKSLKIECRGQGEFSGWKVVLKHKDQDDSYPTYEQFFTAPSTDFGSVTLAFSDFNPYFRGQLLNDTEALDTTQITKIGLQTYGGIYENVRQNGPLTLEVNWIKAV